MLKTPYNKGILGCHWILENCNVVPAAGLEPARPKPRDFKSLMSTIPSRGRVIIRRTFAFSATIVNKVSAKYMNFFIVPIQRLSIAIPKVHVYHFIQSEMRNAKPT